MSAVFRYFGPALSSSVRSGAPTADESQDLGAPAGVRVVVDHGEHDSVAEAVDQPASACDGCDADGHHLVVADAVAAQVVDQLRPASGGLAGTEPLIAGEVVAEPAGEVVAPPGVSELALEERQCEVVDLEHALA